MNKIRLKMLLWSYRNEINDGELTHIKDLIAILVINDLSRFFPVDKFYNFNAIDLYSLMDTFINKDEMYKVPALDVLDAKKKEYEIMFKKKVIPLNIDKYNAAITWLQLMIKFDIIKVGDRINLRDYNLGDFINDYRLINIFKDNINKKKIKK